MYTFSEIELDFGIVEAANLFRTTVFGQLEYNVLNCDLRNFESNDSNLIHKDINFQLNQLVISDDFVLGDDELSLEIINTGDDFAPYGTGNLVLSITKDSSAKDSVTKDNRAKDGSAKVSKKIDLSRLGLTDFRLGYINSRCSVKASSLEVIKSTKFNPTKLEEWDGLGKIKIQTIDPNICQKALGIIKRNYESYKNQMVWKKDEGMYSALMRILLYNEGHNVWARRNFYRNISERHVDIKAFMPSELENKKLINRGIDLAIKYMVEKLTI